MKTNGKINVLQLVEGFGLGGAEKKLKELVEKMDCTKFHTVVCSLGLGDKIKEEFEKLRDKGVEVIEMPRERKIDFGLIFKIAKLINEKNIDIVMTTLFYADVIGPLAGKLGKAKAVFSWETISAPWWLYKRRLWAYRFSLRYCKKVVSVSEATAKWLVEKRGVPEKKVMVIPYGVDIEKYSTGSGLEKRKTMGWSADDKVVGMVGRLVEQKGHIYLIDAAREVVKKYPQVKFVLVGDGYLRSELEAKVRAHKLNSNFIFLGFRDDVHELLTTFDIFVLPSLYEGLPNVVLEAMASGLPVVATPVDGTKEAVVDGETGILIPERDGDRLAIELLRLLDNHCLAKKFGKKGRKRVEDVFSVEKQVKRFEALYASYV
ncbi:MAG TPA: glycosyltransferase [bacterium]|nr:glycosyltransferase [bacterium]